MKIERDTNESAYIQWDQSPGCAKRAWVKRHDNNSEKDWAGTGRYLLVVRCNEHGNPAGNPTDFPIFRSDLSDEQILEAFVSSVNALTGCVPVVNSQE